MRRRDLLTATAMVAWPFCAGAQQSATPVIGFLHSASAAGRDTHVATFLKGVGESGFFVGQNVAIEYRWAENHYERLPALAADLVRQHVSVIAAIGTSAAAYAARGATSTIPIVFQLGSDPVKDGLVASMNHPGGNITGMVLLANELESKRLGLLHEVIPKSAMIAVLLNPSSPPSKKQWADAEAAAHKLGRQVRPYFAKTPDEIDAAFATLVRDGAGGVLITGDPFLVSRRQQSVALTARHGLPAISQWREFTAAGGLMSYGTDLLASYRQTGAYVGRVLKGEPPASMPIIQSTKFYFTINLKTAKTLGVTIPSGVLAIADEVIE